MAELEEELRQLKIAVGQLTETVTHRREERESERQQTAQDIAGIREYVEGVKTQRDREIAERPTRTELKQLFLRNDEAMALRFAKIVDAGVKANLKPFEGLPDDVRRMQGMVEGWGTYRSAEINNLNSGLLQLRAYVDQQLQRHHDDDVSLSHALRDLGSTVTDLRHVIHGDPTEKDGQPSLFAELRSFGQLIADRDAALRKKIDDDGAAVDLRMEALERRLTPIEQYIQRQIDSEAARAERRRKIKEAAVALIKNSPTWFKAGLGIIGAFGGIELLRQIIAGITGDWLW